MTMTSTRGKRAAGLTLSLAVLLSASTLGAGIANAATVNDGTPPAYTMTAAEQAQIDSYTHYVGGVTSMSLDPAVEASWAKIGFSIDIDASIAATNAYNDANDGGNFLIIVAKNDIGTFVANSSFAASIDPANKTTDGTPSGIGFLANGGDGAANMTLPEFQSVSPIQLGQISNLYPNAGLTTNDPTTFFPDNAVPAGQWTVGFVSASSSTYAGGVVNTGGTPTSKTWVRDAYTSSDARNADITLGGEQRGHDTSTLVECVTANIGACGVSLQPMAYGNVVGSANQESGSMAVADSGFLTVVSTRHKVMPTATTEATAMTLASGTKVWFTPQNFAAQGLTYAGGEANFFNPAQPIIPAPPAGGASVYSPRLSNTTVTQDASGALSIGLNAQTPFANAPISESIVPAAAPGTYTMTLTNSDPRLTQVWVDQLGKPYVVGASSYYIDTNTTMTVTSNMNGVLTFNVVVGVMATGTPTLIASNSISTSIATGIATEGVVLPSYDSHYILATTPPVVPTEPTTPVDVPAQETTPVVPVPETPTGDSASDPVAPPTGDASSRPFSNLGDTNATFGGPQKAQAAAATTDNGTDNTGPVIANFILGGLTLIGCLVLALRKRASKGIKAIKVHTSK